MKKILLVWIVSVFLMGFVASLDEYTCSGLPDDFTELGINRWMWDGYSFFTSPPIEGQGPDKDYSFLDGYGCSCADILNTLNFYFPEEYGKMVGQWKFGCSSSVMDDFISLGFGPSE